MSMDVLEFLTQNLGYILFIVGVLFFFIYELVTKGKILKKELKNSLNKEEEQKQKEDEFNKKFEKVEEMISLFSQELSVQKEILDILQESDKYDIKMQITEAHHKLIKIGWIDDQTLDCLEKRYACYIREGGNSFIEDLMNDVRKLPKVSPIDLIKQ